MNESKNLVTRELKRIDIFSKFQEEGQIEKIAKLSANIPLLIKHFINLLSRGYSIQELEESLPKESDKALEFICEYQWNDLSNDSKKLLLGISKNGGRLSFAQAILLCNFTDTQFSTAREELLQRSFLIEQTLNNSLLETLSPITSFASSKFGLYHDFIDEFNDRMDTIKIKSNINTDSGIDSYLYSDEIALNNFFQKADMLERRGEIPQAYKWIIEAIERFPGNALAWSSKGEFEFKYLEDDEKARGSFEKAINLDSKNPNIYKKFAYWEFDRGAKQQKRAYLKKSITLNEEALKYMKNESDKRVIVDHIASAFNKMGYITKQEAFRAKDSRFRLFESAENYFKKVIELLSINLINNPSTYEEIRHNVLDYQMMINAYIQMGGRKGPNRDLNNSWATLLYIEVIKIDPFNEKIIALFNHPAIQETFMKFGLSSRIGDENFLEEIIPIEKKLQSYIKSNLE